MKEFSYKLHKCLSNNNRAKLQRLLESLEFNNSNVDDNIYVKLITFGWDDDTILSFAKIASDDQLSILIATAILKNHPIPFREAFGYIRDPPAVIKKHHLRSLFLIASDNFDKNTLETMIDYGCFDPSDSRPIITVFRRFLEMKGINEDVVELILKSHPGHIEPAEYLRDECILLCKLEDVKASLLKRINEYIAICKGNVHSD